MDNDRKPAQRYVPKGSMCGTCRHQARNCGHLPFHEMRVIEVDDHDDQWVMVVRCTEYVRAAAAMADAGEEG